MSFSVLTTTLRRLFVGCILTMLLVIGMMLAVLATSTTATRGTEVTAFGAATSASAVVQLRYVFTEEKPGQLNSGPPAPGCGGSNASNPACQNGSGSTG